MLVFLELIVISSSVRDGNLVRGLFTYVMVLQPEVFKTNKPNKENLALYCVVSVRLSWHTSVLTLYIQTFFM